MSSNATKKTYPEGLRYFWSQPNILRELKQFQEASTEIFKKETPPKQKLNKKVRADASS